MILSDLLTLRVDFRDEQAAARITPEQANAYLAARGWQRVDRRVWHVWNLGEEQAMVPRERLSDYGRRMVELLNRLAEQEGRSVLAVYVDIVAAETGGD
jgi:hypothetical protein